MNVDVAIIGAGPGGLSCAKLLAQHGARTVVLEKRNSIGRKVCAGGITWGGLLGRIPDSLIERSFDRQTLTSPRQQVLIRSDHPMVATINRIKLGCYMAQQAEEQGALVLVGTRVVEIGEDALVYRDGAQTKRIRYEFLVGADGSHSLVRSHLNIKNSGCGFGLNFDIPGHYNDMVWNLDSKRFRSGYSWIFPHQETISAGAYVARASRSANRLKNNLIEWLTEKNVIPQGTRVQAERINTDFRGWKFGRKFLVGDAAGLASPLTGEGIFPAIVSGEAAARSIIDRNYNCPYMKRLIDKHRKHRILNNVACSSPIIATLLAEVSLKLLGNRMMSFSHFEMA